MSVENLLLHYRRSVLYNSAPLNWIGPEDGTAAAQTLRAPSVTAYAAGTHKCTKKFGTGYAITDVTNGVLAAPRSDGGGVNKWWYEIYDIDTDTLLGTVKDENGASAFVDGSALASASTGIYIKIVWKSGTVAINGSDTLNLTTDVDAPLAVRLPGEDITSGSITLALSASGSTYYAETDHDQTMKYGGYIHTSTGTSKYPYRRIQDSIGALGALFLYSHVLDSEIYNEKSLVINGANENLQAASGFYPTISFNPGQKANTWWWAGANVAYHNGNAIFVNENGDDANAGRWQEPKATIAGAIAATTGAKPNVIYGGIGATISDGIFFENIAAFNNCAFLGKEEGYLPRVESPDGTTTLTADKSLNIQGWYIKTSGQTLGVRALDYGGNSVSLYDCTLEGGDHTIDADSATAWAIRDCEIFGAGQSGIAAFNGNGATITGCLAYDCGAWGIYANGQSGNFTITHNKAHTNVTGFYLEQTAGNMNWTVTNNLSYGNTQDGYWWQNAGTVMGGTLTDNIAAQNARNGYGAAAAVTGVRFNSYGNGTAFDTVTVAAFNGNDGADAREVDPVFVDAENDNFGLSAESPLTKIPATEADLGPKWILLEIDNDDVTVNGITFDGDNQYNNGIMKEGANDWEGTALKYLRIRRMQGIGFDDYCDGATNPTETDIDNCQIDNCGEGVKFWGGNNTVDESIIFRNAINNTYDIYDTAYNRVVSYGAENGFNFGTGSYNSSLINCIINGNSLYGIQNAGVSIRPTYCCITDAVGTNVDITAATNFTSNPLFISLDIGSSDFDIKTVELGYTIDSDCKGAGSDGGDVGAWNGDRSVASWSMRNYEFEFNPNRVREGVREKGLVRWQNGLAAIDLYASGFKNVFDFNWGGRQPVSKELRLKIKYMAMQIKNRLFGTADERRYFRLHLNKDDYRDSGAAGVVDAAARTLTQAAAGWTEFEHQGWHVGVKYDSGVGTGTINDVAKTLTINPDPGFTVDEHVGRFIYHDYNYYYIKSNTSDVLTLSDPDDTLVTEAGINWAIELYFKILETDTDGVMELADPDGLLVDGTYEWYIDFIEVVLPGVGIMWSQPQFDPDKEHSKNGFSIMFEER